MNLLQPHIIVKEGPFLSHRKSLHLTWRRSGSTTGNWKLARRSVACGISRCLGWLCALGSVAGGLCLGRAESPFGQGSSLLPWLGEIKKLIESCAPEGGTANSGFLQSTSCSLNKAFSWSCTLELSHLFLFWFHSTFCFFSVSYTFAAQPSLQVRQSWAQVFVWP